MLCVLDLKKKDSWLAVFRYWLSSVQFWRYNFQCNVVYYYVFSVYKIMYIKNVRYQSNLYIFIFSAMLSWTTHLKPDSEPPKELLSVDALLNIGMFRLKSLMKTLIWLALKSTFQRWHGITLKTSLVLKKKTRFMTVACAKLICLLKIVLRAMSVSTALLFLFLSESVKVHFLPRVDTFSFAQEPHVVYCF
jgi:hypothetical protein